MVRVTDDEIRRALVDCNYNQSAAAKALGINRSSLYERIQDNPLFLRAADQIGEDELLAAHALHAGDVAAMARELRCSPKPLKKRISDVLKTRK
jgi:AraC-like DNA-binding protein